MDFSLFPDDALDADMERDLAESAERAARSIDDHITKVEEQRDKHIERVTERVTAVYEPQLSRLRAARAALVGEPNGDGVPTGKINVAPSPEEGHETQRKLRPLGPGEVDAYIERRHENEPRAWSNSEMDSSVREELEGKGVKLGKNTTRTAQNRMADKGKLVRFGYDTEIGSVNYLFYINPASVDVFSDGTVEFLDLSHAPSPESLQGVNDPRPRVVS